jgi:hypothetical protein
MEDVMLTELIGKIADERKHGRTVTAIEVHLDDLLGLQSSIRDVTVDGRPGVMAVFPVDALEHCDGDIIRRVNPLLPSDYPAGAAMVLLGVPVYPMRSGVRGEPRLITQNGLGL